MTSIGDRLEEARKRQGISLREAAEATKIRVDFLSNFERNDFDFDLPDVYKRGFLKLYARYLKVDVDKIMTDYNAVALGNVRSQRRDRGEHFGRIDLPETIKALGSATHAPFGDKSAATPPSTGRTRHPIPEPEPPQGSTTAEVGELETDTTLYWKIGLVFLGFFIAVGIVYLLISALSGRSTEAPSEPSKPAVASAEPGIRIIRIHSTEPTRVIVRQEKDDKVLFNGITQPGQVIELEGQGPVRVVSTEFQNIGVEIDGRVFRSSQSGLGQHTF